ncbi:hypothetical protein [Streptomyces antibioticus]|uniref:hypothetical protein n=1 Tax=Streptomyces antibioticus TaxID=1890 RepID=UPI0033C60DA5
MPGVPGAPGAPGVLGVLVAEPLAPGTPPAPTSLSPGRHPAVPAAATATAAIVTSVLRTPCPYRIRSPEADPRAPALGALCRQTERTNRKVRPIADL